MQSRPLSQTMQVALMQVALIPLGLISTLIPQSTHSVKLTFFHFVILLYRLDCSLTIVCLSMAVLCGLLIVVKLNTQMCVLISVYDISGHFPLIAILVLFIVFLVVYVCIMFVFNASVSCISLLVVAVIVQFFNLHLFPVAISLDTT